MARVRSLAFIAVLFSCVVCGGAAFGLAGDSGAYYFTKSVDKVAVNWGDQVTYTYTVSNENSTVLYDVTVVDDAGTPNDTTDDFTAGHVDELHPGESVEFTKTMPLTPDMGGEQARVSLIAGQHYDAGDVIVYLEDGTLRIVVETKDGWELTETQLYLSVGDECDPPSKSSPGRFPYKHENLGGVTTDEYVIDVPDIAAGDVVTVALHAVVRNSNDGGTSYQEETAWGEGEPFPKAWGMYFCLEIDPPDRSCVTNTAVVTAKAYDSNDILRPYWQTSDTATVCVYLDQDFYDISGKVCVDLSGIGLRIRPPAAGIPVELRKGDGTLVTTVETGSDGTYAFKSVPPGTFYVLVPLSVELSPNFWAFPESQPGLAANVADQDLTGLDFCYSTINSGISYGIVYTDDPQAPGDLENAPTPPEDESGDKPGKRVGHSK